MKRSDDQSPEQKALNVPVPPTQTVGSRLAHWPPPGRTHISRPILAVQRREEPVQRAKANAKTKAKPKSRGWRLTRALFSEFEGEEE